MEKRIATYIIVAIIVLASPQLSMAVERSDGTYLLRSCLVAIDSFENMGSVKGAGYMDAAWCLGFTAGIRNVWVIFAADPQWRLKLCWPEVGPSNEQVIRIVVKYLQDNPASLHRDPTSLVMYAYIEAFKCDK